MRHVVILCTVVAAILTCLPSPAVADGPVTIGEHVALSLASPHPYGQAGDDPAQPVWAERVYHPGATYISVHFERMDLAVGDTVVVRSPDSKQRWTYTRYGRADLGRTAEGFFATRVDGDTAVVELFVAGAGGGWGYSVDRYGRGYNDAEILDFWNRGLGEKMNLPYPRGWGEALCTADNTEEAKCYLLSEPTAYERSRAIARLTLSGSAHCTGWLVGTAGHLITNEHCISSQTELNNIDFEFMAEGATCATNCATALGCPGTIEASGGTFLTDHADYDYALVLPDTTAGGGTDLPATYGYLQLRDTGAVLNERIYVVQHPAGWGKRFAMVSTYPSDVAAGGKCYASSLTETPCAGSGYNDVGYFADTQGGSSGSPVLAYSDHKVVALHHCAGSAGCSSGGASDDPNRGVPIQRVITDLVAKGLMPPGALCDPFAGPASLDATAPGANVVALSWAAVGGIPGVTYDVYRSLGSCPQSNAELLATGVLSTSLNDTSVSGGTTYAYTVVAVDPTEGCESAPSPCDAVTATGACTLPPTFAGATGASNQATETCALQVTWGTATSQCGGAIRYSVYRSTTADFDPTPGDLVASGLTSSPYLDVDSLASGVPVYYVVRATDIGNGSSDANDVHVVARPTGPITVADWLDTLEIYADMAAAEAAGWGHAAAAGSDDWTLATGSDATTGTGKAFSSADVASITDKWLVSDGFVPGASSVLTFWHKHTFEGSSTFYDGAVLEVSTNGGSSWADLGGSASSGGYGGALSSCCSNPLGGRQAWVGTRSTFGQVTVPLAAYDGQAVNLRWRMGSDSSVAGGVWLIDQFAVNAAGVPGACTPGSGVNPIFSDGFEAGSSTAWSLTKP